VHPIRPQEEGGLYLHLGQGSRTITAAIAPGLVTSVGIHKHEVMRTGLRFPVTFTPSIFALDGEREIVVNASDRWEISLSWEGPRLLDIEKVMDAVRGD
jgi:hypothetical protein